MLAYFLQRLSCDNKAPPNANMAVDRGLHVVETLRTQWAIYTCPYIQSNF